MSAVKSHSLDVLDHRVRLLDVGTLKAHNNWLLQVNFCGRIYNALCDYIAPHDAPEDVDENRVDVRVLVQQFERHLDRR